MKNIESVYFKLNRFLQYVIFAFLTAFVTKGLTSWVVLSAYEHIYTVSPSLKITILGLLLGIIVFGGVWVISSKISLKASTVFVIYLLAGVFWIVSTQVIPDSDALHCLTIADEFNDGIFFSLEKGQYFDTYRLQEGLILYEILLTKIFGSNNYLAFQVLNCIFWSLALRLLYKKISETVSARIAMMFFLMTLLYFPIWMTENFVYGNVMGMSLAVIALVLQNESITNNSVGKGIAATFLIAISCLIKGIMYIPLIAFVIIYVCIAIEKKNFKYLLIALLAIATMSGALKLADASINAISGGKLRENGGTPSLAWVVMGSDIYSDEDAPGWYNATNVNIYKEAGYDKDVALDISKKRLSQVFDRIKNDPVDYLKALIRKNNTIWNEPTFQVFFRSNDTIMEFNLERHSVLWNDLVSDSGRLHRGSIVVLRFVQILVYVGVMLYIAFKRDIKSPYYYVGLICFFGAVLFYGFYEAKSEYVLIFFTLLIPYSVIGFDMLFAKLAKGLNGLKELRPGRSDLITALLCVIVVLAVSLVSENRYDDESLDAYLNEYRQIYPGTYSIVSNANGEIVFDNIYFDQLHEFFFSPFSYILYDNTYRKYYKFLETDEIDLTQVDKISIKNSGEIKIRDWKELDDIDTYQWKIERESGGYIIRCWYDRNQVWTYDEQTGSVYLDDYQRDNVHQVWNLK